MEEFDILFGVTVNLGNYENLKVEVHGHANTADEVRKAKDLLSVSLDLFGNGDEDAKAAIQNFQARIFDNAKTVPSNTCDSCDGKGTNACKSCPDNPKPSKPEAKPKARSTTAGKETPKTKVKPRAKEPVASKAIDRARKVATSQSTLGGNSNNPSKKTTTKPSTKAPTTSKTVDSKKRTMPVCHDGFGKVLDQVAAKKAAKVEETTKDEEPEGQICAMCGKVLLPQEAKFASTMAKRDDICKSCAIEEIKAKRRRELEKLDRQQSRD